jgi:hypothetical protein
MKQILLPLLAAAALAAPVSAKPAPAPAPSGPLGREVQIPFVNFGGVRNFHADGRDAVYLQDRSRRWYRATLIGPCLGLPFANAIGIDSRGSTVVDRFATLIVEGDRCKIDSLTRSDGPPKKVKKPRGA